MSLTITGEDLITRALRTIGVVSAGVSPTAEDLATGFELLEEFIDSLAIQALTVSTVQRAVFDLIVDTAITSVTSVTTTATVTTTAAHGFANGLMVTIAGGTGASTPYNGDYVITVTGLTTFTYTFAGSTDATGVGTFTAAADDQGGPDHPYMFGPSGTWSTGTAARPPSIQDAMLLLNTSSTPVEIPLAVLTIDMNAAIPVKTLTNPLPVELYFRPTVPLAQVFLWPIPTESVNQVVLYYPVVLPAFGDTTAAYLCPPGLLKVLRLGLAESMLTEFAVPPQLAARIPTDAADALNQYKQANVPMTDQVIDPAFTPNPHGTYVIQTDQGA